MKTSVTILLTLLVLLSACGKQGGDGSAQAPAPAAPVPAAPPPAAAEASPAAPAPEVAASEVAPAVVKPTVKPAAAALGRDEALALAGQSGCLACHKIEAKLVGPAWQDVAAKYRGDAAAKARLIAKVRGGGQGNWTEVTGGMPMPPYSPRVSDENIEKLVGFVLSL